MPTDQMSSSPSTFPTFIRGRIMDCISPHAINQERITIDQHASDYFNAVNTFLIKEGEQPIDMNSLANIPSDLSIKLANNLNLTALRGADSAFLYGSDVKDRVNSHERNQNLADLMRATSRYFAATTGQAINPSDHFKLWKQVPIQQRDGSIKTELQEVPHIDPNECAIIGLTALFNTHSQVGRTERFHQRIEGLLNDKTSLLKTASGKPIGIYVVTYPDQHPIHTSGETAAYNANPEGYVSPMTRDFVHQIIIPYIGLNDTTEPNQINACLRKLNFANFSYGSVVCREIRNVLAETLFSRGLHSDAIKTALGQVYALNIAPVCRLDEHHEHGTFSNIYQVSKNDHLAFARADFEKHASDPSKPLQSNPKFPRLIPISSHELMVWDDTPISVIEHEEHEGKFIQHDRPETGMETIYSSQAAALLPHSAGISRNGHLLKLSTAEYPYIDIREGTADETIINTHDPSHLKFSLRNSVGAPEIPADLSETFEPPPPDAASATEPRPKLSEVMKQAIRNFRDGLREKIRS